MHVKTHKFTWKWAKNLNEKCYISIGHKTNDLPRLAQLKRNGLDKNNNKKKTIKTKHPKYLLHAEKMQETIINKPKTRPIIYISLASTLFMFYSLLINE